MSDYLIRLVNAKNALWDSAPYRDRDLPCWCNRNDHDMFCVLLRNGMGCLDIDIHKAQKVYDVSLAPTTKTIQ